MIETRIQNGAGPLWVASSSRRRRPALLLLQPLLSFVRSFYPTTGAFSRSNLSQRRRRRRGCHHSLFGWARQTRERTKTPSTSTQKKRRDSSRWSYTVSSSPGGEKSSQCSQFPPSLFFPFLHSKYMEQGFKALLFHKMRVFIFTDRPGASTMTTTWIRSVFFQARRFLLLLLLLALAGSIPLLFSSVYADWGRERRERENEKKKDQQLPWSMFVVVLVVIAYNQRECLAFVWCSVEKSFARFL